MSHSAREGLEDEKATASEDLCAAAEEPARGECQKEGYWSSLGHSLVQH